MTPFWPALRTPLLALCLCLGAWVFLPGVSGPYMFDDFTNIIENNYVKIQSLDPDTLYHASFSLDSGPLRRPVSMLSFALNYRFSGSFADPAPYKITNVIIHIINGLLAFWLMRIVLQRLTLREVSTHDNSGHKTQATWLAFGVAFLWLVHPIQISSVLYLVQRMTELAAGFTMAALIFYLKGREAINSGRFRPGTALIITGVLIFGSLGVLSKENAILLPVFILILEFSLFSDKTPWDQWKKISPLRQRLLLTAVGLCAAASLAWVISHEAPLYASRHFNMAERLLTEGRVLFFYLSLILLPQIDRFGNQHDDIALSTSLLEPWTTLPALLGHGAMIMAAIRYRKRVPFFSLGILWFYAGHLLESTVIPLEIAHEHRNYLPSLGIMLVLAGGIHHAAVLSRKPKLVRVVPMMAIIFSSMTLLRAIQWSNEADFTQFEVLHHPESARSQSGYAGLLFAHRRYDEAIAALRKAAELNPNDITPLLQIALTQSLQGTTLSADDQEKILSVLRSSSPINAGVFQEIKNDLRCLSTNCRTLQGPMEQWLRAILGRTDNPGDRSFYHYALGITLISAHRADEGILELRRSSEMDPRYLHPFFALQKVYVQLGMLEKAEAVLAELRKANENNPYPRHAEIEAVAAEIEKLKALQTSKPQTRKQ